VSTWRKSTFSSANGQCVEAGQEDGGDYRKSSRSMNNGNCLEAGSTPGAVMVRDTADRGGPVLAFPAGAWAAFTARITGGAR
jgi:hypothetical protein